MRWWDNGSCRIGCAFWRFRGLIGRCWSGAFGTAGRRLGTCNGHELCCLSTQGLTGPQIAERVGCTELTVVLWRGRFAKEGLAGLEDRARTPPPRTTVTDEVREEILTATLTRPPAELGITHWSSRLLAG